MIAEVVARAGRGAMRGGLPCTPCETLAATHVAADSMVAACLEHGRRLRVLGRRDAGNRNGNRGRRAAGRTLRQAVVGIPGVHAGAAAARAADSPGGGPPHQAAPLPVALLQAAPRRVLRASPGDPRRWRLGKLAHLLPPGRDRRERRGRRHRPAHPRSAGGAPSRRHRTSVSSPTPPAADGVARETPVTPASPGRSRGGLRRSA